MRCNLLIVILLLLLAAGPGCSREELPVVSMLREADSAFESGNHGRAAYLYYQLCQRFPDMPNIRVSLGYTYLKLGWDRYGGGEFSKALELSADTNAAAWVGLGIYYSRDKQWDTAVICFSHARSIAPGEPDVYRNLGNAFYYNREYSQAARNYEHAVSLGDRSDELYNAIGLSYERNTQWDKAVKAYEKAHKLNQKNPAPVYRLAVLYRDRFNVLHKTKLYYDLLKKLDPEAAESEKVLFEYQLENNIVTNPNIFLTTASQDVVVVETTTNGPAAVDTDPEKVAKKREADRYEMLAKASLENNLPQAAIKQYLKVLDIDPARGYINRELATIYEKTLADLNPAIKYFERYLRWCEKHNEAKFQTTVSYVNMLREKYNAQEAEKRKKILDEERRKQLKLAELERKKEAERKAAIEAAKKEPQTYNEVIEKGADHLVNKEPSQARRLFQKAIKINPEYPNAYYNIGLVSLMETNFNEAISYFNVALEKNPGFAKGHLALGAVYDRLGKKPEAIEHYTFYLELAPDTSTSELVKQWLARNAGAE
jgi:tetratricopeptide (TPR) repeat protein